jgi:hypothetical protein
MDVQYETIKSKFEEIKHNLTNDLKTVARSARSVNYTAALLIACACESLARFKYGRKNNGDQFFRETMLPDAWKPVSRSLYDALRDGLAHAFETMNVKVGSKQFDIGISWSQQTHLTFNESRTGCYLNVQNMVNDLLAAIDGYEQELINDPKARARFYETMREMKNGFIKDVSNNTSERAAWEELRK